jgi:transposase-like protein
MERTTERQLEQLVKMIAEEFKIVCQWCDSTDTYMSGYSPLCVESQYKCKDCHEETWHNNNEGTK